jgi:hypothetical protein
MPVILASWEVKIRRTVVQGQPGQNVSKTTSQPTQHGGTHLSSQLDRKHKMEDDDPGRSRHKCEILFQKQHGLGACLMR